MNDDEISCTCMTCHGEGVPRQLPSGRALGYLKQDKVILRSELD